MPTTVIGEVQARRADVRSGVEGEVPDAASTVAGKYSRFEWVILLALAVAMVAQLWTSVVQLSITSDEIDHLHAAYRYWQCNDFGWNPEHPPVVKIVAGLPLQFMRINDPMSHACGLPNSKAADFVIGHAFIFANPEAMLTAARFAVSIFSILLLLTVWFFARKMFGLPVAVICGVVIAFDPGVLAHGALVTTDVGASLGMLLAIYAAYCYAIEPTRTRLLALSLAVGLALCLKHSMILLAVIVPAVLFTDTALLNRRNFSRTLARQAVGLAAVAVIALAALWASYGFRYAARPAAAPVWSSPRMSMAHGTVATKLIPELESRHILPQAYLVGLQDVLVESEIGRPSFLLGKLYRNGNWFYFPVVMAIKLTVPLLLLILLSAISVRFWKQRPRELLFVMLPVVLVFAFSMSSKLSIGFRHILPILPLLTIFAAAGAWNLVRSRKWPLVAVVGLLSLHIASSLHAYPNYLSYSNELWGGPTETYRYLANSDVDWGQAQKMARDYVARTHPASCFFLRTYNNKNADYDIPCQGISELQWDPLQTPYTGTMIVSASMVDGIGVRGAAIDTRRVFKDLKPIAKLGGSALLIYGGTFDLRPLVAHQLLVRAREIGETDQQMVLDLARQAETLDPKYGDAHVVMCASYQALGQPKKAEQECNTGLELVRNDPQYGPEQIKYLEDFIAKKGLRIYSNGSAPQ